MTKTNISDVKEEATDRFGKAMASASDKAKEALDSASEKAQDACCALTKSVKEKPLVYLGFAVAVGIALGAVFLPRRSD